MRGTFHYGDASDYLRDLPGKDGDVTAMKTFKRFWEDERQRIGQAFFNAIPEEDQNILRGSLYDPFHKDSKSAMIHAVEHIYEVKTRPETKPAGIRWGEDLERDCRELKRLESYGLYAMGYHDLNCSLH